MSSSDFVCLFPAKGGVRRDVCCSVLYGRCAQGQVEVGGCGQHSEPSEEEHERLPEPRVGGESREEMCRVGAGERLPPAGANLFRLGSINPRKKFPALGCFFLFELFLSNLLDLC